MSRPSVGSASVVPGVPFIATWETERGSTALLEATPEGGLRWFNEDHGDRDRYGGLWARKSQRIGQGKAQLAGVHPRRHRRAVECLLCQVCGHPASVTREGVLWLEPITPGEPLQPYSAHPPICLPCAIESRERCKRIVRDGAHAVRVANPRPWGVIGTRYEISPSGGLIAVEPVQVGYDDPAIRWVLAGHMVSHLDGMTPVDLDEEYAHYLATDPDARPAVTRRAPQRRQGKHLDHSDTTSAPSCPVKSGPDHASRNRMCDHEPTCPSADAPDADAAHLIASCAAQGWSLLCNGVLLFADTGEIRPDMTVVPPRRAQEAIATKVDKAAA